MLSYQLKNLVKNLDTNFLEELPPVEVSEVIVEGLEIKPDPDTLHQTVELQLPLKADKIRSLQRQGQKN